LQHLNEMISLDKQRKNKLQYPYHILRIHYIMNTLSQLLSAYRKTKYLTQKEMVEELFTFNSDFSGLNTVTLSRWETGTTKPSLKKRKYLLSFFAANKCFSERTTCYKLGHQAYEDLYVPLSAVFTRNYQYLIGNFPELNVDFSSLHPLSCFPHADEHIEHIIDIETVTNVEGYYTLDKEKFHSLCAHPSSFAIICERKRQHLGHFVMFKVKNHVAKDIVYHRRNEHSLTTDDLCAENEKGTYYIHALYGKNLQIAALLNVKAYIHLYENLDFVENIAIFSSRNDGVLLTKDYGIKCVAKGKDVHFGFGWHGMLSPVEDILFSDTVVKLIF